MRKHILLLGSIFALGACAYAVDGTSQEVTFLTPGAYDALCFVYVDGLKHKVRPPQKIILPKSQKDLEIDCLAPGNRRKQVTAETDIHKSVIGDLGTGVAPGVAWDYVSNAMFSYPDVIEISFVDMAPGPEPLPAQNNPDIKQPEEYYLEEFRAGEPQMNADRHTPPTEIQPRQRQADAGGYMNSGYTAAVPNESIYTDDVSTTPAGGKGMLTSPIPLYPGE